jgi:hypothetical protein
VRRPPSPGSSGEDQSPHAGSEGPTELQRELRELCRGRGVLGPDLPRRLGPAIAARVGGDSPAAQRGKVVEWLTGYLGLLPADLQLVASVGLGLHPPAEARFLGDRLQWLGEHVDREQRTVRRRLDEALTFLAELMLSAEAAAGPAATSTPAEEWYYSSIRTLVSLDRGDPEVIEQRTIVPTGKGLGTVTLAMSVARAADGSTPEVGADILFGGLLSRTERPSRSQVRFVIELPNVIGPDEEHLLCLRYRLGAGQRMPQHYALIPMSRCDEFRLRIRFALPAPQVWLLPGVLPRSLDDDLGELGAVSPNRAGEAVVSFAALQRGLGYGLRWS